jgi:hypothetical protein
MSRWDKKPEEPKEEIKPEIKEPVSVAKEPVKDPMVIMSDTDAYIHERLKSQPKTLKEAEVKVIHSHKEGDHVLSLPKEIEQHRKKFAFRWLNKKKRAIDHALDVVGWSLVNRAAFNTLPDYLFSANGVIERGDAILAFMPEKQAAIIRKRPGEISRERVKNLPVQELKKWEDRGDKYYKPDLGSAESDSDSEYAKGNRGIVVQPDAVQIEE